MRVLIASRHQAFFDDQQSKAVHADDLTDQNHGRRRRFFDQGATYAGRGQQSRAFVGGKRLLVPAMASDPRRIYAPSNNDLRQCDARRVDFGGEMEIDDLDRGVGKRERVGAFVRGVKL